MLLVGRPLIEWNECFNLKISTWKCKISQSMVLEAARAFSSKKGIKFYSKTNLNGDARVGDWDSEIRRLKFSVWNSEKIQEKAECIYDWVEVLGQKGLKGSPPSKPLVVREECWFLDEKLTRKLKEREVWEKFSENPQSSRTS